MTRRAALGCPGCRPRDRARAASVAPTFPDHDLDQVRIRKELGVRQIGQHPPLRQRDDAMRIGRDQIHVVLDQKDRLDPRELGSLDQSLHDAVLVGGGDARGRLVEQNDLRIEREGRGDVEQLLLALRERRSDSVEPMAKSENVGHLAHAPRDLVVTAQPGEQPPPLLLPRYHRGRDRLHHGQLRENLDELERAREPVIGKRHRPDAGNALAHEQHLAAARLEQAGQQVDQGRFASAIRTDDRNQLARVHREADVIERLEGPVEFADLPGFQKRAHAALRANRRRSSSASPATPAGKAMTMSARTAPRMKRQYCVSDCSWSCSSVKVSAPTIGPKKLEKPPSTVMNTSCPDCVQYTSSGSARPIRKPMIAPPAALKPAEMTNAASRKRRTCTPRYSALRALSRIALRCRPKGEWTMRHITRAAITSSARQ